MWTQIYFPQLLYLVQLTRAPISWQMILDLQILKTPFKPQYHHVCSLCSHLKVQAKRIWLNKDILISMVTTSFILITCMFDQVVILSGEIRCLSLLGLQGLRERASSGFSTSRRNSPRLRSGFVLFCFSFFFLSWWNSVLDILTKHWLEGQVPLLEQVSK